MSTNGEPELDSTDFNNVPPNAPPLIDGSVVWTANVDDVVTVTLASFDPVAVNEVPPFAVLQVTKNPVVVFVDAIVTDVTTGPPDEAANVQEDPVALRSKIILNPDGA